MHVGYAVVGCARVVRSARTSGDAACRSIPAQPLRRLLRVGGLVRRVEPQSNPRGVFTEHTIQSRDRLGAQPVGSLRSGRPPRGYDIGARPSNDTQRAARDHVDVVAQHRAEDDILDDDREPRVEVGIGRGGTERIAQSKLPLCLGTRSEVISARPTTAILRKMSPLTCTPLSKRLASRSLTVDFPAAEMPVTRTTTCLSVSDTHSGYEDRAPEQGVPREEACPATVGLSGARAVRVRG